MNAKSKIQYACAVVLIVSSIALAFLQVLGTGDIANGTLMYIAQAFLLAGSIFGLEYYIPAGAARKVVILFPIRNFVY